ncbi:reverse transcriptase domain-containing protein [Tanacetum coccineum]
MKRAPECMRISGFVHGVNNPELTKRLNEHVPKTMEEMMTVTTAFIRGETAAASKKKRSRTMETHRINPKGMFLSRNLTSEVSHGKDGGLAGHSTATVCSLKQIERVGAAGRLSHLIKKLSKNDKAESDSKLCPCQRIITFPTLTTRPWGQEGRLVVMMIEECATVTTSFTETLKEAEVRHENFKIALHPNFLDQEVAIGGMISAKGRIELCSLLKKNLDIFVWQPSDMTGVLRPIAEHRLNIREGYSPIRQKKRGQAPERAKAIQAERNPESRLLHDPTHQLNISAPLLPGVTKWRVMLGVHISRYRQGHSVKGTDLADFPCREASQQHQRYVSDRNPTSVVVIIHGQIIMCRWIRCWPYTDLCRWERRVHVALRWGFSNVHVSVDSKLVANQFLGTYDAKEENMVKYLKKAKSLINGFVNFSISQVPRGKNKKADALRKITSTSFAHLSKQVLVEVLKEKSIQEEEVATVEEEEGPTWMTLIMDYLKDGTLLGDRKEASKLRIKAR